MQRPFSEKEVTCKNDEQLASACLVKERDVLIKELYNQNAKLLAKHMLMQLDILKLTQQLMAVQLEPKSLKSPYDK